MVTALINTKKKVSKLLVRRRLNALMEAMEGRTLFAVTVDHPIGDVTVRPSAPVGTIPLAGIFSTTNLDNVTGTVVRMPVSFGFGTNAVSSSINVALFDQATPLTVQNFLNYVNSGAYANTIVHRTQKLATDGIGIVQGGGFTANFGSVQTNAPVPNEFSSSPRDANGKVNTRGTIAMAKTNDPNSATSQWFINTADNSAALDDVTQPARGFTTFGKVIGGLTVADQINALTTIDATRINPAFGTLPVADFDGQLFPGSLVTFAGASVVANPKTFLSYTASSTNTKLVNATVDSNNNVTLTYVAGKAGTATISVIATDLSGASVTDTFTVTVSRPIASVSLNGTNITNLQSKVVTLGFAFKDQSATRSFLIKNTGTGTMNIGTITLPTGLSVTTAPKASLAAGESTTFVVTIDTSAAANITGNVLIANDAENAIAGGFSFPISASVGDGITLGSNGVKSVTYTDADGSVGVFTYAGPGTAKVTFTGGNLSADSGKSTVKVTGSSVAVSDIVLAGSTKGSSLTASASKGTDKQVTVETITSATEMKAVTLKGVIIDGSVSLTGGVSTLTLGKLDSATVTVPGAISSFAPGDVLNSTVTFAGAVKTLTFGNVSGSAVTVGGAATTVKAKSIGTSTVTFSGGVSALTVSANLSSSSVDITGIAKKISAQQVLNSHVTADGVSSFAVTSKAADSFSSSVLDAGAAGTISLGQLTANGTLSSVLASSINVLSGKPAVGKAFSLKKITSATDVTALLAAAGVPATRLAVTVS